jgi:diguanylate cyclase
MLSFSRISRARRGLLLAGGILFGGWLLAHLVITHFNRVPLWTLRTVSPSSDTVIETHYNAFGIFGLAVPAILVLGVVALFLGPPVLRLARDLLQDQADQIAEAGEALERELATVISLTHGQLIAKEAHTRSLASVKSRITQLSGAEQLKIVVDRLIADNERMRRGNTDYQRKIEACAREIEALESSLSGAEQAALKDPLTGIGNRRRFDTAIAKAVDDSNARKTPLSLIMCDIDHFKHVNDAFGHQVGDEIIKLLAQVIQAAVRDTDTVARYGGEEFAIILPMAEQDAATSIAERIRRQFEAKRLAIREINQKIGQLTASFGVAQHRPGDAVAMFVQRADAKLYEAKTGGRNRVAAFDKSV